MATATDIEREYWAARHGAGLADRSDLGRLRMSGADALDLLHRLSTQDLRPLKPGLGTATVLTSDKGRIIDLLTVLAFADHLLLLASPGNATAVRDWIEKYTITEDCQTTDVTESTALLHLVGPKAGAIASALTGRDITSLSPFGHMPVTIAGAAATLVRAPAAVGDAYHMVLASATEKPAVVAELLRLGEPMGLAQISPQTYEALRIEAGLPAFGHEMDERWNPLEAGFRPCISFNKGCYIGQEVVARLDTYDKVQRAIVGLLLPDASLPAPGSIVQFEGKEAGVVTSVAYSPGLKRAIALSYVRNTYAKPGTRVQVVAGSASIEAAVVALPFAV